MAKTNERHFCSIFLVLIGNNSQVFWNADTIPAIDEFKGLASINVLNSISRKNNMSFYLLILSLLKQNKDDFNSLSNKL